MHLRGVCRGGEAVAPVIHEWTYEAMAYDLLGLTGQHLQVTCTPSHLHAPTCTVFFQSNDMLEQAQLQAACG